MDFESFTEEITENRWKVHGVEVYRGGERIHSFGDTVQTKYPIYSATKTILSVALGIAHDRGKIDFEKSILFYMPEEVLRAIPDGQREVFGKLSLHRMMTMSVDGFPFRPEGDSYFRFSFACEIKEPEKKSFHYSNIPAYLSGVALANALGEDVCAFITREILEPLDINGAEFSRCPDGYFYGASGMKMSVHDLSQIGLLLYEKGSYKGKRIVSKEYVEKATSPLQMNKEGGYGYFIWKYQDGFSINGKWNQRCYILPERDLVITYLSDIREDSESLRQSMERNLF
ncbi:MAG: beta-lactamase family protein [Lachnospiraceae bacterium]|nr:beta-lactamase family protein [Lachnospiraceae bacterium]